MKTALVRFVIAAACVVLVTGVRADTLKSNRVAADAQWLAHIDMEALAKSQLLQFVLSHQGEDGVKVDGLDEIKAHFGIDVLHDLKGITVYGNGKPDEDEGRFIAIVTGNSALDGLVDKVKEMGEAYDSVMVNNYLLHSFKAEEDEIFFHIVPGAPERDRVVVIGKESVEVMRAITVVEGKTPNAADAKHPVLTKSPQPGSFFFVAADGVAGLAEAHGHDEDHHDPASSMLKEAKSLVIDAGELNENSFVSVALDIAKPETATNVADLIRGLVAMGKLAVNSNPELASLKEAINSVQLKSEGSTITVRLQQKTATILGALQNLHDADEDNDVDEDNDDEDEKDAKDRGHSIEIGVKVGEKKPD